LVIVLARHLNLTKNTTDQAKNNSLKNSVG